MKHLLISISGHGYGHIAQTAPVINALHRLHPKLQFTVKSSAPLAQLESRIRTPFQHLKSQGDIGMVMTSALSVNIEDSCAAYQAFHDDWQRKVTDEADQIEKLGADMLLSNVGYLSLAGAQQTGIKNFALCSLNWSDIYRHYAPPSQNNARILEQIRASYADAHAFLRATPGMMMNDLPNLKKISPIAETGVERRDELHAYLGLAATNKLVLVSMGGISNPLPVQNWPKITGVSFLMQSALIPEEAKNRSDLIGFDAISMSFSDILASADALLCKPGYGSFVEAVCSGIPVLYVGRADWPESSDLIVWLKKNGQSQEITTEALNQGEFSAALDALWSSPTPVPVIATGAMEVAELLLNY